VVRGHAGVPEHVLVIATLGAPQRRLIPRRQRPTAAAPEPAPEPVATSRVTIVHPTPTSGADEAAAWLSGLDAEAEVDEALRVIATAVQAHRIAAADHAIRTPTRAQALVVRVGYGQGEQVSEGRWVAAQTIPGPSDRQRRSAALGPQERFGSLLSGRDVALAAETLALDARRDLDARRYREAALHLRVALEAALAELVPWADQADLAVRLEALRAQRETVAAAANAALRSGLDDQQVADVTEGLRLVEAALRARAAAVSGLM
jgi:hypothetical protein